jgi:hypothetical protein
MRTGRYKLIENFDDNSLELYDLEDDLSETHNLADEMPERARMMVAELRAWRESRDAAMPRRP